MQGAHSAEAQTGREEVEIQTRIGLQSFDHSYHRHHLDHVMWRNQLKTWLFTIPDIALHCESSKGFLGWNCRRESENVFQSIPFSWPKLANKRDQERDFFRRRRCDKRRRSSICGILNVPDFEFSRNFPVPVVHFIVCKFVSFVWFCMSSPYISVFCVFASTWGLVRSETCEVVALTRRLSQLKSIHLNGHLFPSSTLKYPLSVRQGCKGEGGGNPGQCDNHQGSTAEVAVGVRLPSSS